MNTEVEMIADIGSHEAPKNLGERGKSHWVWLAFGALLVLYLCSAINVNPVAALGNAHDDALYWSSAKALASGQGYILPSFPIPLRATKYPELYPAMLAEIWKVDPHFPQNVRLAVALTLAFGCAALFFAFLLLRRWPGLGDWDALGAVALCVLNGYFLELSGSVMSDVPFMALALGAIWLVERSVASRNENVLGLLGAGVLGGISIGFRSLGMVVLAGIGLGLLIRRNYRGLLWFSGAAGLVTLTVVGPTLRATIGPASNLAVGPGNTGWTQTLCYYSSYGCSWRMGVNNFTELKAVVVTNLGHVIQMPGQHLLMPWAFSHPLLGLVAVMTLSVLSYFGVLRHTLEAESKFLMVVFALFLPVLLAWPYTPTRFLVPFLPLFFGGLWLEIRHFASLASKALRSPTPIGNRAIAALATAGALTLAVAVAVNYFWAVPLQIAGQADEAERTLRNKASAYSWIRGNAVPDAKIIAYDDGLAYLYTGRLALVPIQSRTQSLYLRDARYSEGDAARLADVACHIGASYWLVSRDDYRLDWEPESTIVGKAQGLMLTGVPTVFESQDKSVQLYDIRQLTRPDCALKKQANAASPGKGL